MKTLFFVTLILLVPQAAQANGGCSLSAEQTAKILRNRQADPAARSAAGTCAIRNQMNESELSAAVLHVIQDRSEDLFLREDLIEAFGDARLRRRVKVEESLAPQMGKQDTDAVEATLGGAGRLLAAAQAVKSVDETEVVCPRETEFVRTLSSIARDSHSHVMLREAAVTALEKNVHQMLDSKVFNDKALRLAQESLAQVAGDETTAGYYSGASQAYNRLADAGIPFFSENNGRSLASVHHQ